METSAHVYCPRCHGANRLPCDPSRIVGILRLKCRCGEVYQPRAKRLTLLAVLIGSAFAGMPLNVWKVCRRGMGTVHAWGPKDTVGVSARIEQWTRLRILVLALNLILLAYVAWNIYHPATIDPHAPILALTKFFMTGGSSNYSDDSCWSTTSSLGPNNTTHAVAGDTATMDVTSPSCVVDTASACTSIVCTGYTNTLTFNANLTVAGGVTLVAGMTIAGTSTLLITANGTLASAGKTLTGGLTLGTTSGTVTTTVTGTLTVNGLFTLGVNGCNTAVNGGAITAVGGLTGPNGSSNNGGTTVITMTGGTLTGASSWFLKQPVTIAGNVTLSGSINYAGGPFTYTSGTVTVTSSTLVINNSATTLNLSTMHLNNYTCPAGSVTVTLSSALNIDGTATFTGVHTLSGAFVTTIGTLNYSSNCTLAAGASIVVTGATTFTQTCTVFSGGTVTLASATLSTGSVLTIASSNVTVTGTTTVSVASSISGVFNWTTGGLTTTNNLTGTSTIVFGGTGTWTGAAGSLANNCTINTAGTLTLSGTILYTTGTITYTAGTVSVGTSILSIASGTLTTSGMSWANVKPTGTALTLGSAVVATGTWTLPNSAFTFSGAFNITVGTLTNVSYTATRIVTFVSGTTILINTDFTTVGGSGAVRFTWKASSSGVTAAFKLGASATQSVNHVDPTDLNASGGPEIVVPTGVFTNSVNWVNSPTPPGGPGRGANPGKGGGHHGGPKGGDVFGPSLMTVWSDTNVFGGN